MAKVRRTTQTPRTTDQTVNEPEDDENDENGENGEDDEESDGDDAANADANNDTESAMRSAADSVLGESTQPIEDVSRQRDQTLYTGLPGGTQAGREGAQQAPGHPNMQTDEGRRFADMPVPANVPDVSNPQILPQSGQHHAVRVPYLFHEGRHVEFRSHRADETLKGGRYYNTRGQLTNAHGKLIDEDGKLLNPEAEQPGFFG